MARGLLVEEFILWQADYAGASVEAFQVGTTTPATLFFDEAMTLPAPNPQTLLSFNDTAGNPYGRFAQPIYSAQGYYLEIDNFQQTGNRRPALGDLVGVDASQATAVAKNATQVRTLADHFSDAINVLDFGGFLPTSNNTQSPATNNATLTAAIGAAAAAGGGDVICPAGSYEVTGINIPGSVTLRGRGMGVTTLVCKTAAECFTTTGSKAGLRDITLDGVNLVGLSVGLTGLNLASIRLENVEVKRFDTGVMWRGGSLHRYDNLWVANCNWNTRFLGDLNASAGSNGGPFTGLEWNGGQSIQAVTSAVEINQIDQAVAHIHLSNVSISDNPASIAALYIYGAQFIELEDCSWASNTIGPNIWVRDSTNMSLPGFQSAAITVKGGEISTGTVLLDGLSKNVLFDSVDLETVTFQLNDPASDVILRDCIELGTSITGDTTKLERQTTRERGSESGITTSATPVVAWQRALTPGEVLGVNAKASAIQLNGPGFASFDVDHAAHQLGASLNYNTQSANFTVGNTLQGQTSGATATIQADSDGGTTGTLTLVSVNGTFVDGELINELSPGTGSAHVNGVITVNATALLGSLATLFSALAGSASGWTVTFDCNGQNLRCLLTAEANKTVQWKLAITETAIP